MPSTPPALVQVRSVFSQVQIESVESQLKRSGSSGGGLALLLVSQLTSSASRSLVVVFRTLTAGVPSRPPIPKMLSALLLHTTVLVPTPSPLRSTVARLVLSVPCSTPL